MVILCYASAATLLKKVSSSVINLHDPGISIELFQSLDSLHHRLCRPTGSGKILILCPKDKAEMDRLRSMQDIFSGMKIILALSGRDEESLKSAHRIFPRFLVFIDENFSLITRVLQKMTRSLARQENDGRSTASYP